MDRNVPYTFILHAHGRIVFSSIFLLVCYQIRAGTFRDYQRRYSTIIQFIRLIHLRLFSVTCFFFFRLSVAWLWPFTEKRRDETRVIKK